MNLTKKRAAEIERDKARATLKAILCEASRLKQVLYCEPGARIVQVVWVCRYNGFRHGSCTHRYSFYVVQNGEIRDITSLVAKARGEKLKEHDGHWVIAMGGGGYNKPDHCIGEALGLSITPDYVRVNAL